MLNLDYVVTVLPPDFNLKNLDLLETIGTGTFGRGIYYYNMCIMYIVMRYILIVRIVKDIKTKQFYALKIMKKARIVRMKQIGY